MVDNSAFVRSIDGATEELIMLTRRNMQTACLHIKKDAMIKCPVDMGILRASIHYETELTASQIVGRVGSNLEYAPYVHQGTGIYAVDGDGRKTPWAYTVKSGKYAGLHWTIGQKPQPFLKDAIAKNKEQIPRILGGD